jgi:hypothetical protein
MSPILREEKKKENTNCLRCKLEVNDQWYGMVWHGWSCYESNKYGIYEIDGSVVNPTAIVDMK